MPRPLRISARSSPLALTQAEHVQAAITAQHAGVATQVIPVDAPAERVLSECTGLKAGVCASVLERALIGGGCDEPVRRMNDVFGVPLTTLDTGFAAYLPRGDRRDALVNRSGAAREGHC
ncbi:hypothetical protein AB8O64_01145 [Streptomyces sp. QH1-20]|uniref:hypothetical protein n=1 Tax=Streptomyces sp. QH1-20 TaxID=3240934 RepID=UPI00351794F7